MLLELYVLVLVLHGCWCADLVYTVEERRNPDTLIGDISQDSLTVNSIPSEERSLVTFIQLKQDKQDGPQLFKIHKETGKLYTVEVLDAEIICKRNSECFRMLDVAIQKGTSTIKILEVKVIIQDVNDHQPTFPEKKMHIEFSEGDGIGIRKAISSASDDDIGTKNSNITYQLIKNRKEPFKLTELRNVAGKSYLSITLEKMLDREAKDSYLLQVTAKDGASPPKQGILDVYISVSDLNDNTPIFSKDTYKVTIKNELSKHSPIATVSASDLDAGENGQVSYHFSSETPEKLKTYFELNEKTGKIFFVKKFSLEQEMTHNLFIEATDKGSPPLSSLAKFQVSVTGQENSAPTININFVSEKIGNTVKIPENLKVGGFIAYVKIFDHDNGENGEVSCSLDHDRFQLHNLSTKKYQVILTTELDRETETDYDIEITCQDKGSPPLQSKSKFSIKVTDVNDVRPQFSMETFKFLIEENEKSRFSVGFINATDPDLGVGGKLTYSLLTNNKQFLPFKIKDDGMISAIMSLDHEFQNIYKFQVFVKDNGIPSLNNTVNVIVEVTDKNDNAPYFTFPSVNPYNMDVVYYRHHSKNITCVKAADGDSQENAFLKYEIIRGNDKQMFTINQYTGLLTFNRVLAQQDTGSYELMFVVKDSGSPVLSATTSMFFTVKVRDKNDNAPYFTFPSVNPYNMDVTYYPHHTKNISQIKASDSDSQENAFLKYEIIRGNSKQIFSINQYTGLLCSTHVLSQQDAGSYELEFLVKDSGSPVLSARTTVYLTLTVSNKTSEMLNAVNIKKDNKINLTSAIIIVSVAVMIAVIITVSVSVCILQCNRQKNMVYKKRVHPSSKAVHEQKHSVGPSYHGNSWHHVPLAMAADHTLGRNGQLTASSRHSVNNTLCIRQKTVKTIHKANSSAESPLLHTRSVSISHGYITWKSAAVSHPRNSGHHWNEKDMEFDEQRRDLIPSKPCIDPSAPLIETLSRRSKNSEICQKSRNRPIGNKYIPNNRPLPPIPQTSI